MAYDKEYYEQNRERILAQRQEHYRQNRERLRALQQKRHQQNLEKSLALARARSKRFRVQNPERRLLMYAATRAKKKGIVFDLKPEDIVIPDVCPVLGIKMERGGAQWNSPSLDRFDNSKGYTPDNVRVISSRANQIKSDATAEELLRVLAYVQETK